jgi:hypothetical protein
MESKSAALFVVDIYESYDKVLSKEKKEPLFPIIYEDASGYRKKWYFLKEHTKDIYNFIQSLIEIGIIDGRVLMKLEEGR